jgi:hypothetical protein
VSNTIRGSVKTVSFESETQRNEAMGGFRSPGTQLAVIPALYAVPSAVESEARHDIRNTRESSSNAQEAIEKNDSPLADAAMAATDTRTDASERVR